MQTTKKIEKKRKDSQINQIIKGNRETGKNEVEWMRRNNVFIKKQENRNENSHSQKQNSEIDQPMKKNYQNTIQTTQHPQYLCQKRRKYDFIALKRNHQTKCFIKISFFLFLR